MGPRGAMLLGRGAGRLDSLLGVLARRGGRGHRKGEQFAALRHPLGFGIDSLQDLLDRSAVEVCQDLDAELVEQRSELQPGLLRDETVEPGALRRVILLLRHHTGEE